jgi:hypothetical protein
MKLPMQLQHKAMTRKQRSLSSADLLKKAFAAGWNYADQDSSLLIRPVPYHTRETYFTMVFRNYDSAKEHIAKINLQYCAPGSRVWKKII